jgi:hypothetical protein
MASEYDTESEEVGEEEDDALNDLPETETIPTCSRSSGGSPVGTGFGHRTLVLGKRGISSFLRHFLKDFVLLLGDHVRESKFGGASLISLNEIAETHNCDHVILFETLSNNSHLMSIASTPGGPTACFSILNLHAIKELHFLGECSPKSRRILFFDPVFDDMAELSIIKELLRRCFSGKATPESRESFIDTCLTFAIADEKIWVSRYQISWEEGSRRLFEAGPRFCLDLLAILSGSFCGRAIYKKAKMAIPVRSSRRQRASKH